MHRPKKPMDSTSQLGLPFYKTAAAKAVPPAANGNSKVTLDVTLPSEASVRLTVAPVTGFDVHVSLKIREMVAAAQQGAPEERPDMPKRFYARPRRRAQKSTGSAVPAAPPYPKRGTPACDAQRVTLRQEFKRAVGMMSGAAKAIGFAEQKHYEEFNREGMQGLYGANMTTSALHARKEITTDDYWNHAGVAELSYNILRMRAATSLLNTLPLVKFIAQKQEAGKKPRDVVAPEYERIAARNRLHAERMHRKIGAVLRKQFNDAHRGYELVQLPPHPALKPSRARKAGR